MNFNAEPKIIQDILSLEREYVVPRYQREYSWEEEEQIQEFWEDINEQIDYECTPFKAKEYFIGSLVLIKDTDSKYYIIDGQQRLTSLYLGLKGTYAYKMPRKRWKDDPDCMPIRKLYLNLSAPLLDDEKQMNYDFKFLSSDDFEKLKKGILPALGAQPLKTLKKPFARFKVSWLVRGRFRTLTQLEISSLESI